MSNQEVRKQKAIEYLFSNTLPIVNFRIPSVICPSPPWKSPNKQELVGDLYFTDKGIVFVQLASISRDSLQESALGMYGAAGGIAAGHIIVKRRKEALARAKTGSGEVGDFRQVLEKGGDVILMPRATISKIRHTWAFGFQVNTSGNWQQFLLEKGKKTYQQYQSQIEKYLAAH